jgi:hypothetical protein
MTQLVTLQKEQMNGQKDPAILHREFEVEQTRSISPVGHRALFSQNHPGVQLRGRGRGAL